MAAKINPIIRVKILIPVALMRAAIQGDKRSIAQTIALNKDLFRF